MDLRQQRRLKAWTYCIFFICGVLVGSRAQSYFEINGFYLSKNQSTSQEVKSTDMYYEATLGYQIDKAKKFKVGWSYLGVQDKIAGALETKYTSTHMGPKLLYSFDKEHRWVVGVSYLLSSQSKVTESLTDYTYKGSSIKGDLGYQFLVSEWAMLSLRLNYLQSSWTERLDASDTYTKTSHKKTLMWPSAGLLIVF